MTGPAVAVTGWLFAQSDFARTSDRVDRVFVTNLANPQPVKGTVEVGGTIRHGRSVAMPDATVSPAGREEVNLLTDGGFIDTDGFTPLVLSIQGQIKGRPARDGAIGVILLPEEEPRRQSGGCRPRVRPAARHLEDRHVQAHGGKGCGRAGHILGRDSDPHRPGDRLEHGIHDDLGVGLPEEGHPLLVVDLVLLGRPEHLVDEIHEGLALGVVGEHRREAIGVGDGAPHRVAEPCAVRAGRPEDAEGPREIAEGAEPVLGDRHSLIPEARTGRDVTWAR